MERREIQAQKEQVVRKTELGNRTDKQGGMEGRTQLEEGRRDEWKEDKTEDGRRSESNGNGLGRGKQRQRKGELGEEKEKKEEDRKLKRVLKSEETEEERVRLLEQVRKKKTGICRRSNGNTETWVAKPVELRSDVVKRIKKQRGDKQKEKTKKSHNGGRNREDIGNATKDTETGVAKSVA